MDHTEKKYRTLALIGILGGILFSIGDALLFLTPHFDFEHDATLDLDTMPIWRFGMSALFGIVGMICLLCGTVSMYRAVRKCCGKVIQTTWLIGIGGTAMTAFGHFTLGVWEPLQYKAMTYVRYKRPRSSQRQNRVYPAPSGQPSLQAVRPKALCR